MLCNCQSFLFHPFGSNFILTLKVPIWGVSKQHLRQIVVLNHVNESGIVKFIRSVVKFVTVRNRPIVCTVLTQCHYRRCWLGNLWAGCGSKRTPNDAENHRAIPLYFHLAPYVWQVPPGLSGSPAIPRSTWRQRLAPSQPVENSVTEPPFGMPSAAIGRSCTKPTWDEPRIWRMHGCLW